MLQVSCADGSVQYSCSSATLGCYGTCNEYTDPGVGNYYDCGQLCKTAATLIWSAKLTLFRENLNGIGYVEDQLMQ